MFYSDFYIINTDRGKADREIRGSVDGYDNAKGFFFYNDDNNADENDRQRKNYSRLSFWLR